MHAGLWTRVRAFRGGTVHFLAQPPASALPCSCAAAALAVVLDPRSDASSRHPLPMPSHGRAPHVLFLFTPCTSNSVPMALWPAHGYDAISCPGVACLTGLLNSPPTATAHARRQLGVVSMRGLRESLQLNASSPAGCTGSTASFDPLVLPPGLEQLSQLEELALSFRSGVDAFLGPLLGGIPAEWGLPGAFPRLKL